MFMNTTKSTSLKQGQEAILTGLSRKGYWRLAKTLSKNMGLSKAFLEQQGLVSIRTLWIQIHYPAQGPEPAKG